MFSASQVASGKEFTCQAEDWFNPWVRTIRQGRKRQLQYFCLKNPMDGGASEAIVSPWGHKGLATAYRPSNNKFSVSSVRWLHALTNRSKWPPLLNLPGSKGSWQEETYLISMGDHLTQKYNLKDVRDILTCTQSHCSVQLPTRIAKAGKI